MTRLLAEVARAAMAPSVLVGRPGSAVVHLAPLTEAGLTGLGRLRQGRPVCGQRGRAWSTTLGAGRPLCRRCDAAVRRVRSSEQLAVAGASLRPQLLADLVGRATTLEQVESVASLVAHGGALVMNTRFTDDRGLPVTLNGLVRHARDRVLARVPMSRRRTA